MKNALMTEEPKKHNLPSSKIKTSISRKIFLVWDYTFLSLMALLCVAPLIHELAVSFSSSAAVAGGKVLFFPVGFTTDAYSFVIKKSAF